MKYKINLDDREQAEIEVKRIQKSVKDLLDVITTLKTELKSNSSLINEAEKHIIAQKNTIIDLTNIIKNIQRLLGAKLDLFKDDTEIKDLLDQLNLFVVSSGAIKAGVLNDKVDNKS